MASPGGGQAYQGERRKLDRLLKAGYRKRQDITDRLAFVRRLEDALVTEQARLLVEASARGTTKRQASRNRTQDIGRSRPVPS